MFCSQRPDYAGDTTFERLGLKKERRHENTKGHENTKSETEETEEQKAKEEPRESPSRSGIFS